SYFPKMVPEDAIVDNGYAIADPDRDVMLFWKPGINDTYDKGNGDDITLKLSSISGDFSGSWFDTRKGEFMDTNNYTGGNDHVLTPPSTDDWGFLLVRDDVSSIKPDFKRSMVEHPGYQLGIGGTSEAIVNKKQKSPLFDIRGKSISGKSRMIQIFKTGEEKE
ncbi:MAG: hypothetical protein HQK83_12150, partial [Fibrobacteria bacterium]|nr:hypothetical protein [Fibrobacteria bacterium]